MAKPIASAVPRRADRSATSTATTASGDHQLGAEEHAPADRPEQPLPEEQASGRSGAGTRRRRGRPPRRHPSASVRQDLALDLVGLGLREVDVGTDQADRAARVAASCAMRPDGRLGGGPRVVRVRPIGIQRSSSADGRGVRETARDHSSAQAALPVEYARTVADATALSIVDVAAPRKLVTRGAPRRRHGAHRRRDDRHEQRRARPIARRARRDGPPGLEPPRRPGGRRGGAAGRRSRARTSSSRPAASARRPTTSPARPSPRSAARRRSRTRRRSHGCAGCGRGGASRSRRSTASRRGRSRRRRSCPTPTARRPGWWVDRPDGRVIVTLPGPAARDAADVDRRGAAEAGRARASASRPRCARSG